MRYVEPDSTKLGKFSHEFFKFGDYVPGAFVGIAALGSGITGIATAITVHFLLILLVAPLILYIALFISWQKHTVKIGKSDYTDSEVIVRANRIWWDQLKGEFTEDLALPIMKRIYAHATQHHRSSYWGECPDSYCEERVSVLTRLVPASKSITDRSDVQQALDFIKARKEIESL